MARFFLFLIGIGKNLLRKLTLDGNKLPRTYLLNAHHEKRYACGYCALWAIRDFAVSRKRESYGKNLLRKLTLDGNKLPRTRLLNAHHEKGVRLWRTPFRGGHIGKMSEQLT